MPYKDRNRQRAAQRESARRRRLACAEPTGRTRTRTPLVPAEVRLEAADDVLAVIEGQVGAVLADDELTSIERARVVATLSGVALRAIESGDVLARIEALEAVLLPRRAA